MGLLLFERTMVPFLDGRIVFNSMNRSLILRNVVDTSNENLSKQGMEATLSCSAHTFLRRLSNKYVISSPLNGV